MKVNFKSAFFLCCLLCFTFGFAQSQDTISVSEVYDPDDEYGEYDDLDLGEAIPDTDKADVPIENSAVDVRYFDQNKLEDYRRSGKFNYEDDPDYETSYFQKLKRRFFNWLRELFGEENSKSAVKWLQYLLAAVGISVLLYFLVKASGNSIIKKERKDNFVHLEAITENVSEETLDQLLEAAKKNGEHRAVIRLYFLKCLRKLDDSKQIKWRDHKTNLQYQMELQDSELRFPFSELVDIYEHIWYGEFELNSSEYELHCQKFESFLDQITSVAV